MQKVALAVPLFLLALVQVFCQPELPREASGDVPWIQQFMPLVESSASEIRKYARNPKNKPKLDFKPTGKIPQPESAGVSWVKTSEQIIGGAEAVQKQFPWQAVMIIERSWMCGGSLIAPNWVLTAAHCVRRGSSFVITLGGVDRTTTESEEKTLTSTTAIYHDRFSASNLSYDIAVVKLPENLTLNEFINVVRMLRVRQSITTFENKTAIASGYGRTTNTGKVSSQLNYVSLVVTSNAQCAAVYGTTIVTALVICTAADDMKTTCTGDSGGPLVVRELDGKFTQIGIVSFGARASCTRYPAGYTRVGSYLGWISEKTGITMRR